MPKIKEHLSSDKYRTADRVIQYALLLLWTAIVVFTFITLNKPAWLQDISEKGRRSEAQVVIDQGTAIMYQADHQRSNSLYKKAIDNFQKALKIDPGNIDAMANLGTAYLFQNDLEKALKIFEECLKMDTVNKYYYMTYIGDYYSRKELYKEALYYFKLAASDHPEPDYPLRKAGLMCLKLEMYDEAIGYLIAAIDFETGFKDQILSEYKKAMIDAISEEDFDGADAIFTKVSQISLEKEAQRLDSLSFINDLRFSQDLGYAYMYLGDCYAGKKDSLEALQQYQSSLQYYPPFKKIIAKKIKSIN